ncbi:MAG TPA: hypothetical protein VMZ27_16295 [Candidatus Saccharimonadales bacterium]|nr:hypothetical protein [Candidatus Saccharimonadales bacterium]
MILYSWVVDKCPDDHSCNPQNCRKTCATEVIDKLLREHGSVRGEEVDLLLDLRWLLRDEKQPEKALEIFQKLKSRLEEKHYLLFFRLRRWMENHLPQKSLVRPEGFEPPTL